MHSASQTLFVALWTLIFAVGFTCPDVSSASPTLEWSRQFGSLGSDHAVGVAVDSHGSVYTTGPTFGNLAGPNAGIADAFISKHNSAGTLEWIQQFGTGGYDGSSSISTDPTGNVYIAGSTSGTLEGSSAGGTDAFVRKYDASGSLLWTQQFGTGAEDTALGISSDNFGNIFVTGNVAIGPSQSVPGDVDAFVSKLNASGAVEWFQQIGTNAADLGIGVSADGLGNVYITGETTGVLGDASAGQGDAFLSKFDESGNLLWTQQLGTNLSEYAGGVSADGLGNVFITGVTNGELAGPNAGGADVFVSRYDASGSLHWTQQFGTSEFDRSYGVRADGHGNIYVTGETFGVLGDSSAGRNDAFVVKYDESGALQWKHQFGTIYDDQGSAITTDGVGNLYLSGFTAGNHDAILLKFHDPSAVVPEPASLVLLTLGMIFCATRWRRR